MECTILLNLAYHISHRNNLCIILNKLQEKGFVGQQEPVIEYDYTKKELVGRTLFMNHFNEKYPYSCEEWKELWISLSQVFLKEV